MSNGRSAARISSYKSQGATQDDLRRRREDQQVEIRRQKREDSNAKRRQMDLSSIDLTDEESEDEDGISGMLLGRKVSLLSLALALLAA